ncbi:MAG: 2Fe-2S iron-sulfur cluster binding domain-containing protein [Chloroflexi bacterium]|nr:2Fe-2S iron-sulfur cluster binding domain-containing protein [Chloroflexota bacterium]
MNRFQVDFQPLGRRGECRADQSLLECARQLGVELVSLCNGKGTCGRCKVQVLSGETTAPTSAE